MVRAIECPCGHQLMATDDELLFVRAKEHVASCTFAVRPSDAEIRGMIRDKAYALGDRNRDLARRYFEEVWNAGNLGLIDELFTADYVNHDPMHPEVPPGPTGAREIVNLYRRAFPDSQFRVEDQVCEDDRVVTRWTVTGTHDGPLYGVAPTGKRVTVSGISMIRIAGGRIAEAWVNWDSLGLMERLGVVPAAALGH